MNSKSSKASATNGKVNWMIRLAGGEDVLHERVRSSVLLKLLLLASPIAISLRSGGFEIRRGIEIASLALIILTSIVLFIQWLGSFLQTSNRSAFFARRRDWTTFTLLMPIATAVVGLVWGGMAATYVLSTHVLVVLFVRTFLRILGSAACCDRPGMTLSMTFLLIIVGGAFVLWLFPRTLRSEHELAFIDALFTATSATCVTGLESVGVASTFTPWGQGVVLALVQIGGLGIMTFGAFFVLSGGRRLGLTDRELVREALSSEQAGGLFRQVVGILLLTAFCEIVGALLFYPSMQSHETPRFAAIFHAVSAFCNAGFSLFPDSLGEFAVDWQMNLVFSVLIIVGGLGFGVVHEFLARLMPRRRGQPTVRISLHSRIVVIASLALIVGGAGGVLALEHDRALRDHSLAEKCLISTFTSLSARTAGFQTISFVSDDEQEVSGIATPTRLWVIALMIIGASPGSTGGGVKTVTFTVLILAVIGLLRNRERVEVFGRSIGGPLIRRAAAIAIVYVLTLFFGTLALTLSEGSHFRLEELFFEAASALGTVGFSVGVSGSTELTVFGKLVLTGLMFAGRVGPLTLVLVSATAKSGDTGVEYPEERVIIG